MRAPALHTPLAASVVFGNFFTINLRDLRDPELRLAGFRADARHRTRAPALPYPLAASVVFGTFSLSTLELWLVGFHVDARRRTRAPALTITGGGISRRSEFLP